MRWTTRALAAELARHADLIIEPTRRAGTIPNPVVLTAPRTEVEAFALELFMLEIAATGIRVSVKGDS